MTVTLNETGPKTQKTQNEASACADVRLVPSTWGFGLQELRRTYGDPRELGVGARRAIHQFGDALERLAD